MIIKKNMVVYFYYFQNDIGIIYFSSYLKCLALLVMFKNHQYCKKAVKLKFLQWVVFSIQKKNLKTFYVKIFDFPILFEILDNFTSTWHFQAILIKESVNYNYIIINLFNSHKFQFRSERLLIVLI